MCNSFLPGLNDNKKMLRYYLIVRQLINYLPHILNSILKIHQKSNLRNFKAQLRLAKN